MTLNIYLKYYHTFIYIIYLLTYTYTLSAHETKKIIQISSEHQTINTLTNTIIFQGQVTLKYTNITLNADKIFMSHTQKKPHPSIIKAYGNPATVYHQTKSNHTISGQSLIIQYNIYENTITLINHACIKQANNSIESDNIVYSIKNKQIKAYANPGNQTFAIFRINPT